MTAKTIIAICLVTVIVGGFIFLQIKTEKKIIKFNNIKGSFELPFYFIQGGNYALF